MARIRVINKQTGQKGTIDERDFNPAIFEVPQVQAQQQQVQPEQKQGFIGGLVESLTRPFTNTAAKSAEALFTLGRMGLDKGYRQALSGNASSEDLTRVSKEGDTLRQYLQNKGATTEGGFLDKLLLSDKELANRWNIGKGTGGDLLGLASYGVPVGKAGSTVKAVLGRGALSSGMFGASDVIGEDVNANLDKILKGAAVGIATGGPSALLVSKIIPGLINKIKGGSTNLKTDVLAPKAPRGTNPATIPDFEKEALKKAEEFGLKGSSKAQLEKLSKVRAESIGKTDKILSKSSKTIGVDDLSTRLKQNLDNNAVEFIGGDKSSEQLLNRELLRLGKSNVYDDATNKLLEKVKGSSRPLHQKEIEKLINAGDMSKARALVDALPEGDVYKSSMTSMLDKLAPETRGGVLSAKDLFKYKTELGNKINWNSDISKNNRILKDIWRAVDDTLTALEPAVKEETLKQRTIREIGEGLAKQSKSNAGNYTVPLLSVKLPTKRIVEGGKSALAQGLDRVPTLPQSEVAGKSASMLPTALTSALGLNQPTQVNTPLNTQAQVTMTPTTQGGVSSTGVTTQPQPQAQQPIISNDELVLLMLLDPKNSSTYQAIADLQGGGASTQKPLSSTTENRVQLANSGLRALDELEQLYVADPSKVIKSSLPGSIGARDYESASLRAVEGLLRARSGAAVPETEVKRYRNANLPRVGDSQETAIRKLQAFRKDLEEVANSGATMPSQLEILQNAGINLQ